MIQKIIHFTFKKRASILVLSFLLSSCSITATRPAQEMSNMDTAVKAAKEVGADLLAPELYRLSLERGQQARKEYRFKNFKQAKELADQARIYAEKAEFESIRNGGKREALPQDPLAEPSYPAEPLAAPATDNGNPASAAPSTGAPGMPPRTSPPTK